MKWFITIFFVLFLVSSVYPLPSQAISEEAIYLLEKPPDGHGGDHKGGHRVGKEPL